MKASESQIAEFDRYLTGEMSASERKMVEEKLKSDRDYYNAFQEYIEMAQAIDAAGKQTFRNRFEAIADTIPDTELKDYSPSSGKNITRSNRNWNIMTWVMMIGSVLLMIAFIIALFNLPDLEKKLKHGTPEKREQIVDSSHVECKLIVPIENDSIVDAYFNTLTFSDSVVSIDTSEFVFEDNTLIEIVDSSGAKYDNTARKIMLCHHPDSAITMKLITGIETQDSLIIHSPCTPEVYELYCDGYLVICDGMLYYVDETEFLECEGFDSTDTGENDDLLSSMHDHQEDVIQIGAEQNNEEIKLYTASKPEDSTDLESGNDSIDNHE